MKKWGGIAPKKALKGSGRAARAAKEGSSVFKAHAGGPSRQRRGAGKEAWGGECLFNCAHKDWRGDIRLSQGGDFTRVPQQSENGGRWSVSWSSQKHGKLELQWSKWPAEVLRTADGGATFTHPDYKFEMARPANAALPPWLQPPAGASVVTEGSPEADVASPAVSSAAGTDADSWWDDFERKLDTVAATNEPAGQPARPSSKPECSSDSEEDSSHENESSSSRSSRRSGGSASSTSNTGKHKHDSDTSQPMSQAATVAAKAGTRSLVVQPSVVWSAGDEVVRVSVELPHVQSASQLQLCATEREVQLTAPESEMVSIGLPIAVDDSRMVAKFDKRRRVLRLKLPVLAAAGTQSAESLVSVSAESSVVSIVGTLQPDSTPVRGSPTRSTQHDDDESRRKHAASGRKWQMVKKNKRRRGHGSAARRKGRRKLLQQRSKPNIE